MAENEDNDKKMQYEAEAVMILPPLFTLSLSSPYPLPLSIGVDKSNKCTARTEHINQESTRRAGREKGEGYGKVYLYHDG